MNNPTPTPGHSCCTPSGRGEPTPTSPLLPLLDAPTGTRPRLVTIPGGSFLMGSEEECAYPADGEGPVRTVTVREHRIGATAVSNAEFAAFADATGYRTDAERGSWSFVFAGLLPDDFPPTRAVAGIPWWRQVHGANWRHPEGPGSHVENRLDHPVVHVSWFDAMAYCAWAGTRLATEAEWEHAARGGLEGKRYPWGDELDQDGEYRCNIWRGTFPTHHTREAGYYGTCPVDAFAPNGYGLHNMVGNVWEWTADWFDATWHCTASRTDPTGPPTGTARVVRGGSFLCHHSYCIRYRVAARTANTPDSTTSNLGFRVAADPSKMHRKG